MFFSKCNTCVCVAVQKSRAGLVLRRPGWVNVVLHVLARLPELVVAVVAMEDSDPAVAVEVVCLDGWQQNLGRESLVLDPLIELPLELLLVLAFDDFHHQALGGDAFHGVLLSNT
ncbi:hypothetical protein A3C89_00745 [Candidatus Kaiserbacteria bacterium RIFCSPHIGHO2_02_FULL_50_50]|uniref:Uncharacterized protein n=1 Tax=Candidatus Kaiserbacteria bacterium RIFCSPHIGHO2_02_FULL_50_50 TaxID=1798492 RepID=A0A1F6DFS2_9BACT|nr:MAG: hypothetical protein A3C89_00745 [Candidatus Kaiserbacteria bacterium RIFCSPHIGHO2_02_FULL_50_50]OGG88878.1 MAG: hypothetical protein A3G62_03185 [Candidatus Kaiserbacteria bacterium RIFCSPLOWO2_12_FULL_50_10]